MSKIKLNTKTLMSIGLAVLTPIVFAGCNRSDDKPAVNDSVGYSNVCPITHWGVDENDFVILDIGDHDSVSTHFQNKKMELCNEKGICVGVVISTDAENESAIYDDVEYAKGILCNHDVKFPVYLNIDKIITNDNLNIEMKTKLIKNFLEKCSANNIYVGLHGTDTNLCRVREFCKITGYDALVVKDKEKISYNGSYTAYQELDGTLVATTNLEDIIIKKGLNDPKEYANDGSYTISSENELVDIALRCGMSVNEILEFNSISKKDIVENTVLRIPSQIDTTVPTGKVTYKRLSTPTKGCDMSYAQGTSINWDEMKEVFDFVILRSNIGLSEDDCFATNANQANLTGIPVGAFCYNVYNSNDVSTSKEFAQKQAKQADYTISILKNKKIEYPVYLDVEGEVNSTTYKKEDVEAMIEIWSTKMSESGYIPGLYCNQSTLEYLQNCVDYNLSDKVELWVAGGPQYSITENDCSKHKHLTIDEVITPSILSDEEINVGIAQCTNIAIGPAGDSRNHLDIDVSTIDYSDREYENQKDMFPIKDFDRIDWTMAFGGIAAAAAIAGGTVFGVSVSKSRRQKQTPKVKSK